MYQWNAKVLQLFSEWDMMILKFHSILHHIVIRGIINPAHLDIRRGRNRNSDKNETLILDWWKCAVNAMQPHIVFLQQNSYYVLTVYPFLAHAVSLTHSNLMTCHTMCFTIAASPQWSLWSWKRETEGESKVPAYSVCLKITVTLPVVILRLCFCVSAQNWCVKKM